MVSALLIESDLSLSDDIVEAIVDKVNIVFPVFWHFDKWNFLIFASWLVIQTFKEVDKNGDGRIDEEEWKEYAAKNPLLLRNMTLPYLMYVFSLNYYQNCFSHNTSTYT